MFEVAFSDTRHYTHGNGYESQEILHISGTIHRHLQYKHIRIPTRKEEKDAGSKYHLDPSEERMAWTLLSENRQGNSYLIIIIPLTLPNRILRCHDERDSLLRRTLPNGTCHPDDDRMILFQDEHGENPQGIFKDSPGQ